MKQSQLFPNKSLKEAPKEEESLNAQLLIRGGFIDKEMAGIYTYMPLGWQVIKKIEQIIREEINSVDGQEMLMPVMQPKEYWVTTKRWGDFDVLFKIDLGEGKELVLGPTHEEVITPLAQKHIFSYKDLPFAIYQFQNKFRNEPRARSGLLRGREFLMKDLYSFHVSEQDLDLYYDKVAKTYDKIWQRTGLGELTFKTYASGGDFSKYSHEYQTLSDNGEDTIFLCEKCKLAVNKEIIKDLENKCPDCGNEDLKERRAIEVGNIFKLKTKFSEAFGFKFTDSKGVEQPVVMASYGIGLGRLMATVVETHHDEKGIVWPKSITPYNVHLLEIGKNSTQMAQGIYGACQKAGFSVLYDDREMSAGAKFAEADLLGISVRLVISDKTGDKVEWKERAKKDIELLTQEELLNRLKAYYQE